jgi:hypothetical protein
MGQDPMFPTFAEQAQVEIGGFPPSRQKKGAKTGHGGESGSAKAADEIGGFPPSRQKKGAKTGHGAFAHNFSAEGVNPLA